MSAGKNGPIRPEDVEPEVGSPYPDDMAGSTTTRARHRLGDWFGITQFGVNLLVVQPGCDSSVRHSHSHEDEFVWLLEGDVELVDNAGLRPIAPGEVVGFPAGTGNAHCFRNRGAEPARLLEVGSRVKEDVVSYPDAKMEHRNDGKGFRKIGGAK